MHLKEHFVALVLFGFALSLHAQAPPDFSGVYYPIMRLPPGVVPPTPAAGAPAGPPPKHVPLLRWQTAPWAEGPMLRS